MEIKQHSAENHWIKEEIEEYAKKFLKTHENGNTTYENLWDAAKALLRGKGIAIKAYIKKQERSQINNLTTCLKEPKKKNKLSPMLTEERK